MFNSSWFGEKEIYSKFKSRKRSNLQQVKIVNFLKHSCTITFVPFYLFIFTNKNRWWYKSDLTWLKITVLWPYPVSFILYHQQQHFPRLVLLFNLEIVKNYGPKVIINFLYNIKKGESFYTIFCWALTHDSVKKCFLDKLKFSYYKFTQAHKKHVHI